jgi:mono/diheme cytochrome c family protein
MPHAPRTPRVLDTPEETRRLDHQYMIGLLCMVLLLVAFPLYKRTEPARRARAEEAMRAGNIELGRTLYAQHCAACHGDDARGGRGYATLAAREFLGSVSDTQLHWLIAGGVPGTLMTAYDLDLGGPFTAQEIARVVAYVRSLEEGAPSVRGWLKGELAPEVVRRSHRPADRGRSRGDAVPEAAASPAPATIAAPAPASVPTDAGLSGVEQVYASRCAVCHGTVGQGTVIGKAIRPLRAGLTTPADSAFIIIARGVPGKPMPPFAIERGGQLDATTIRALVAWLRGSTTRPPP